MTSPHPEAAAPAGTTTTEVLAHKLRQLRRAAHLTLRQLGACSGIATSTLSKIENGQLSPTYEKIAALAQALQVEVGELFRPSLPDAGGPRRSVTRAGQGVVHPTDPYVYELLHTDLADKRFVPLLATLRAREVALFPQLLRHAGEEMVYVLRGTVHLHTEGEAPLVLQPGDSCYFDSRLGHACVAGSEGEAQVLWVSSHGLTPDAG